MHLKAPVPVFRIFDYQLAKRFYVDWLGFRIDWEHQFQPNSPRFMQISRDDAVFHLSEHYGDGSPGANVSVEVDDVAAYHREVHSRPHPNMNPGLEDTPWGTRVMGVIDPFGNRIHFSQRISKNSKA